MALVNLITGQVQSGLSLTEHSGSFDAISSVISGQPTDSTSLGVNYFKLLVVSNVNPASPTSAVNGAILGQTIYPAGAPAIVGAGHLLGVLGRVTHANAAQTLGLAIPLEGKIDNFGAITTGNLVNANLGSNLGTIGALYGLFADITGNLGTITTFATVSLNIEIAAGGSVGSAIGLFIPTLSAPAQITAALYGLYFGANPAIATKFVVFSADLTAPILTSGPIKTLSTLNVGAFTVATLPTGAPGDVAWVSDATAPTYGGALTGGGAVATLVFKTATAWVSH